MDIYKYYFSWSHGREAEGYLSWQHLLCVSIFISIAIFLAIFFGIKYKNRSKKEQIRVIRITSILILSIESVKIVLECIRGGTILRIVDALPLYLCSIQLIAIPIAGFSKGKIQDGALDFVFIFGLLGAILGTFFAGNIYTSFPVIHFDPLVSATTHSIAGFCSLYIGISKLSIIKKENFYVPHIILLGFEVIALIVNLLQGGRNNYMFLIRPDGTPFQIVLDIVNNNKVLYTIIVLLLMQLYIVIFRLIYNSFSKSKHLKKV